MLSASKIILEYVCPGLGVMMGNLMFAAPLRDCYDAVKAGKGFGTLNPTPWAFCTGNCIGWVTYGILKQNIFILVGNAPGLLMSVWLNMQAVKLQYESFRSQEMRKLIVIALDQSRERLANPSENTVEQAHHLLEVITRADGTCPPESPTTKMQSISDAARIVLDVPAQSMVAPAPHDTLVMANVFVWIVVIAIIAYGSAFTDRTKELIVGVTVNLNLVIFYGSPLSVIWTVLQTRSAATIHVPTMCLNTLNGTFWAAYGIAVADLFIAVPNSLGAGLGLIQILLCILFPRNKQNSGKDERSTEVRLRTTGASHPTTDEEGQSIEVTP